MDPREPWPYTVTLKESVVAIAAPGIKLAVPARDAITCWPKMTSGIGALSHSPS